MFCQRTGRGLGHVLVQGQSPCSDMGELPGETPVGSPEPCTRGLELQEDCWSVPKQVSPRGWGICTERWHALHATLESLCHILPQLSTGRGAGQCSGLRDTVWLPHTPALLVHQHRQHRLLHLASSRLFKGPNRTS